MADKLTPEHKMCKQGQKMKLSRSMVVVLGLGFLASCGTGEKSDISTEGENNVTEDITTIRCDSGHGLKAVFNSECQKLRDSDVNSSEIAWHALTRDDPRFDKYRGVVRYNSCSGALLNTGADSDGKAYLLTNGHCVGSSLAPKTGVYFDYVPSSGFEAPVYFHYYKGETSNALVVYEKKVVVYTMDRSDYAIVELQKPYGYFVDQGFPSYELAEGISEAGQEITVVGSPLSGVYSSNRGLRLSQCFLGGRANIEEGGYHFPQALWFEGCSIVGGNSGSPIFDLATNEITGVLNTGVNDNSSRQADCSLNRPCEVSEDGQKASIATHNYGQPVNFLRGCFDAQGTFDKDLETCQLQP